MRWWWLTPSTLSILERSDWRRVEELKEGGIYVKWVWRMYEMFVKDEKAPMSWLEFWLSIFVIRPLPCQVRLHGRSKTDLNKTICFVVGRGVRTGVFFLSRVLLFLCACLALCEISHYLLLCTVTQQIAMKHLYLIRPGAVTLCAIHAPPNKHALVIREHHKIMYLEIWWLKGENGISY